MQWFPLKDKTAGLKKVIDGIAVACALYHILVNSGLLIFCNIYMPDVRHSAVSLFLAITIIYLKAWLVRGALRWHDAVPMAGGLVAVGFVVFFYHDIIAYGFYGLAYLVYSSIEASKRSFLLSKACRR